jgi:hypothetical protein
MGGYGSGRRFSSKSTTSAYHQIDVRRWQREGLLKPRGFFNSQWLHDGEVISSITARAEVGRVILSYRHGRNYQDWRNEDYPVLLEWTRCNFGGERAWFICPARGCGRRVAILYGGAIFACRQCHQLAYDTQNQTVHSRALGCAQTIRMKLGGSPSLIEDFPLKPKGMQWRTYERLKRRAADAEDLYWPRVYKLTGLRDRLLKGKKQGNQV